MLMLVAGSLDRESLDLLLFMYSFERRSLDMERRWNEWHHSKAAERQLLEASEDTTQRQLREHEEKRKACEPPRSREEPLRVMGDGLLRLVRLIRTGLVNEGPQRFENADFLYMYYWEPVLTLTGRRLAYAFVNGDAKAFRELLIGQHEPSGSTDASGMSGRVEA
jgi:hypothetical protein